MKAENRRFLVILCFSTAVITDVLELPSAFPNQVDRIRLPRVSIGMPREEAIRILHRQPITCSNGKEDILLLDHYGWLRYLFTPGACNSNRTVIIEDGHVAAIATGLFFQ